MPWGLVNVYSMLPVFAAVLLRLSGLALTAPIFGSPLVPARIRAAVVVTAAAVITPLLQGTVSPQLPFSMVLLVALSELAIGAVIGLTLSIFIIAGDVAGTVAGQQAGLALSRVVDPTHGDQTSVLGQIYTVILTLVFLAVGGHRATMAALLDSYRAIPLFSFQLEESALLLLIQSLTAAFVLGIRLAGPVLIALFLTGTALGFLSRTMPQLNILTVGFTLRTLIVVGASGLALNGVQDILVQGIWEVFIMIDGVLGTQSQMELLVR